MRRFRLNLALLIAAVIAATAASALLYASGLWAPATLAAICGLLAVWALAALIRRLTRLMSTFVSSLQMNDVTMRFDIDRGDAELRKMSEAMNSITEIYRANTRELETGKLYYDRILRIMTHEMRNSITPVIAISADISAHPEKYSADTLADAVGVIHSQSEGIKHFLDAYYTMTHIQEPAKTTVDAIAFFSRIRAMAAIEAAARHMPEDVCDFVVARDMQLEIDTSLMTQALVNLIRNALDAVAGSDAPHVGITVSLSDGRPVISVADNGPGISPAIADSLFQPFLSTKPGGTGVGLYLSRQIVRKHGGDLRLANSARGATAVISL